MNSFSTQFRGNKIWNHLLYPTPPIAFEVSDKEGETVDNVFCPLDLHVGPWKTEKYHFLSMGLREHPKWHEAIHSNTEAPNMTFLAKMTKMPLVNLGLTEDQTRLKSTQNKNL